MLRLTPALHDVIDFADSHAAESAVRKLFPDTDGEYHLRLPSMRTDEINYIICYVQRSGSTHLTSLLQGTDLAGKPADFFNVSYQHLPLENRQVFDRTGAYTIVDAATEYGTPGVVEYLDTLAGLTRTPNGVFGLKLDLGQASILIRRGLFWNTAWRWKYIFVTRRDLVMQAISYHVAVQTRLWSSLSSGDKSAEFDEQAIVHSMLTLTDLTRRWECVFSLLGIEPLRISYEDIEADPKGVVQKCLSTLGVTFDPQRLNIDSVYRRQRTDQADEWAKAIRKSAQAG